MLATKRQNTSEKENYLNQDAARTAGGQGKKATTPRSEIGIKKERKVVWYTMAG